MPLFKPRLVRRNTRTLFSRFRIVRQPDVSPGGHPSDERLPDRHEAAEGAAEAAQGCQSALLTLDAVPARSLRDHGKIFSDKAAKIVTTNCNTYCFSSTVNIIELCDKVYLSIYTAASFTSSLSRYQTSMHHYLISAYCSLVHLQRDQIYSTRIP